MFQKYTSLFAAAAFAVLAHGAVQAAPVTYQFTGLVSSGAPAGLTVTGSFTLDPATLTDSFGDGSTYNTLITPNSAYTPSPLGINVHLTRSDGVVMHFSDDMLNLAYAQIHKQYWGFENSIEIRAQTLDESWAYRSFSLYAVDNDEAATGMFAPGSQGNLDPMQTINWDAPGIFSRIGTFTGFDTTGAAQDFQFNLTSITQYQVPEPATLSLLGLGVIGLLARSRRRAG